MEIKLVDQNQRVLQGTDIMPIQDSAGASWYKTTLNSLKSFLNVGVVDIGNTDAVTGNAVAVELQNYTDRVSMKDLTIGSYLSAASGSVVVNPAFDGVSVKVLANVLLINTDRTYLTNVAAYSGIPSSGTYLGTSSTFLDLVGDKITINSDSVKYIHIIFENDGTGVSGYDETYIIQDALIDVIEETDINTLGVVENTSKIARELKFNHFIDSGLYQVDKLTGAATTNNQTGVSVFTTEKNVFAGSQLKIASPVGARAQVYAPFNITANKDYSAGFFYKVTDGATLPSLNQSLMIGLAGYIGTANLSTIDVIDDWKFQRLEGLKYNQDSVNSQGFLIDFDNRSGGADGEVLIALPMIIGSATLDYMFVNGDFDNIIDLISRVEAIEATLDVHLSDWLDKEMVTYGDSITAINNGTFEPPYALTTWGNIIANYFGISKHYGRGVGGQNYTWNDTAFWLDSTNGQYVDRARYDVLGDEIASSIDIATASIPQEIANAKLGTGNNNIVPVRGTYPSWERIKNMIPLADRENIELVLIMGGTNDFNSIADAPSDSITGVDRPLWDASNIDDQDWINDGTYGNGGDYDITAMYGGIASTVMKFQTWCPNATIVLLTALSGHENSGDEFNPLKNGNGYTVQDAALHVIKIAQYLSVPVIDIYSLTGINQFNRTEFISDTVHPYLPKGYKALAKAGISGLKVVMPYFD